MTRLGRSETRAAPSEVTAPAGGRPAGSSDALETVGRERVGRQVVLRVVIGIDGTVQEINEPALQALRASRGELVGRDLRELTRRVMGPDACSQADRMLQCAMTGRTVRGQLQACTRRGRSTVVECVFAPLRGASADILQVAISAFEVAAGREAGAELVRVNRYLRLHSDCNRLLIRAQDERSLLDGVCHLIVEEGGYRLAWIGFAGADPDRPLEVVASAGSGGDYLASIKLNWARGDLGGGPSGRAIRERRIQICENTQTDASFVPWREEAGRSGYASSIALPLIAEHACIGCLNIYADRTKVFDPKEIALLRALSRDLAYGIGALRVREERERARAQVDLFRALLQHTNDMIYVTDVESGVLLDANEAAAERLGYSRKELLALKMTDFSLCAAEEPWQQRADNIRSARRLVCKGSYRTKSGATFPVEVSLRYIEHAGKGYLIAVSRDITEQQAQLGQIERLARILRMQSGINSAVLRIQDRNALLQEACRLATEVGGYDRAVLAVVEPDGRHAVPRFRAGKGTDFPEPASVTIGNGSVPDDSLSGRALRTGKTAVNPDLERSGLPVAMRAQLVRRGFKAMVALPLIVDGRREAVLVLTARDPKLVADHELLVLLQDMMASLSFAMRSTQNAEAVQLLVSYDSLTGLPNRARFVERLDETRERSQALAKDFAVVAIDVRGLSRINDTFGRHFGDLLLQQVANRIRRYSREEQPVCHLGGGTFVLVEPLLVDGESSPRSVLEKTLFADPLLVDGRSVPLSCNYGVAYHPKDGTDGSTLLQRAEAALKQAKESGEGYLHYRLEMHSETAQRLDLEHRLSLALTERQFALHYQAQVDLASGRVDSVEALLRWQDPRRGLVSPGEFLPVLESTGLILAVGDWVLERAVEDCEHWCALGAGPLRVSVNVSAMQLRRKSFADKVLQLCQRLERCPGFGLDLEITESTFLQDMAGTSEMLGRIRSAGVRIALDDFGTGYSSLGMLSKLPVDVLKIDRSFVTGIPHDGTSVALVENILRLASVFRLTTVVEGVETHEQLTALRAMRCDRWQGYLCGRPVPADAFARLLLQSGRHAG